MVLHSSLVYSNPFYCVQRWNETKERLWKESYECHPTENMKNVLLVSVYGAFACLCHIDVRQRACVCVCLCVCVFIRVHLAMWMCVWSVALPACLCTCASTLPHVYTEARVCECDSVREPVGSLPVVCSSRYAYGENRDEQRGPLCLCSDERQQW